jgi:phosphatidylglycerophosphate synthase
VIGILLLGLLATMVCLALQVVASVLAVRYFARVAKQPPVPTPRWAVFLEFSILMLLLMLGSLGYGDVVLNGRERLIAPLQAANGLMMFGITTGLFIAAFQHAIKKWIEAHRDRAGHAD